MTQVQQRKAKTVRHNAHSNEKDSNNSRTRSKRKPPYQTIIGFVFALVSCMAVCLCLYWNFHDAMNIFARSDQQYSRLTFNVNCSNDYKDEHFEDCKPKTCGRVVTDDLVTDEEALYLLGLAKKGLSYGGSNGGASILDLHSGALSKGGQFVNIYRILDEENAFTSEDFLTYRRVKNKIQGAIAEHFEVPLTSIYLTKPTFFSRMNTSAAKTTHDEYWHRHVDKTTYGSFHYTSLLYLTTYGSDFTGGRFVFVDGDRETAVEPRIGRVSFFTSGSENVHYVEKLETGTRYAITISFTCDPHMAISDPDVR